MSSAARFPSAEVGPRHGSWWSTRARWSSCRCSTTGASCSIRNTRFAIERTLWELPAGTRTPGEPVALCAARELEEETGYRAGELRELLSFYPAPGITDERMHAFVARGLVQTGQQLDETEQIEVHPTTREEVLRMIKANEIEDAKSIATVLFWALG